MQLWRRVVYHRIQNHIPSQTQQLEEDFAEFKHALSVLKANHEDLKRTLSGLVIYSIQLFWRVEAHSNLEKKRLELLRRD